MISPTSGETKKRIQKISKFPKRTATIPFSVYLLQTDAFSKQGGSCQVEDGMIFIGHFETLPPRMHELISRSKEEL